MTGIREDNEGKMGRFLPCLTRTYLKIRFSFEAVIPASEARRESF
jgi:hypothetical protein